jgi:hypothetical protein
VYQWCQIRHTFIVSGCVCVCAFVSPWFCVWVRSCFVCMLLRFCLYVLVTACLSFFGLCMRPCRVETHGTDAHTHRDTHIHDTLVTTRTTTTTTTSHTHTHIEVVQHKPNATNTNTLADRDQETETHKQDATQRGGGLTPPPGRLGCPPRRRVRPLPRSHMQGQATAALAAATNPSP